MVAACRQGRLHLQQQYRCSMQIITMLARMIMISYDVRDKLRKDRYSCFDPVQAGLTAKDALFCDLLQSLITEMPQLQVAHRRNGRRGERRVRLR